jgi:peptidyl-prolyl cis-trans isomerase C
MRSVCLLLLLATTTTAIAQTAADDVVITRGGVSVTLKDVDTYVSRVPKEQRERFIDSPSRIRDMLNNMLLTKQLAAQARAEHLEQRPDVANQLRAEQDNVLAGARMTDYMNSIKVPDLTELAREQYLTHKDLYKVPAKVDVRQLLISTEKRSDDEARALAEKVRAEALASPDGFESLVDKYSDDASKTANHGLMKDATSDGYVKEFRDAAAALTKVGEISPVVHTTYGYHVLRLVSREPERQQTFDEVREQLTASMREQFIANTRRDFVNQLNNEKTDVNPATLDTLRDRYDATGKVKVATDAAAKGGSTPPPAAQQPAKNPH